MNWKKKKAKSEFQPPSGKNPRSPGGPFVAGKGDPREPPMPNPQSQRPSWHLKIIDFGGPYCPTQMDEAMMHRVHEGLSNFESRLWREIEGWHSHAIKVEQLAPEAQRRLRDLEMDDIEEVFSLRLGAKLRVFGIRDSAILRLLWWDQGHEICPSTRVDN